MKDTKQFIADTEENYRILETYKPENMPTRKENRAAIA